MISITCTHCQTVLTIDDAFAGGVCRCQHCGTIQTVPSQLKPSSNPGSAYAGPKATTSKKLYQNTAGPSTPPSSQQSTPASSRPQATSRELDALAQVVASSGSGLSSGLASVGARGGSVASPETLAYSSPQAKKPGLPIVPMIIGAGVTLLVVGIALYFFLSRPVTGPISTPGGSPTANGNNSTAGDGTTPAAVVPPNFCGVPLKGNSIVYVLDRGNSLRDSFDPLKNAVFQSIKTLGVNAQFSVLLFNNGSEDIFFPEKTGFRNANADQLQNLSTLLDTVNAGGASHLSGALDRAVAQNPDAIVLVTAKAKFEKQDAASIKKANVKAHGKIKIYTFLLSTGTPSDTLKDMAKSSGGEYREITAKDLRDQAP